ncbi:MAG: hypothetical protein ACRD24_13865 [Terriglobales bacterium]
MADGTTQVHVKQTERRPAKSERFPWYDSVWLASYTRAQSIIQKVKPGVLAEFVNAFQVFRTRPDFQARLLQNVIDAPTLEEIRRLRSTLRPTNLELHEAHMFGRFVVHDHPVFTEIQERLVPVVSEAVGEPVESAYNFLSLYGARGVCRVHMDAPKAKWTLDLCVNQNVPWPIYLSQVCPWPESANAWAGEDWEGRIKRSPSLHFTSYTLEPGQALVFSGSSQWHYREPIPDAGGRQFCDLLFLHFIPRGTAELVRPENWARLFGIPELSEDG